MPDEPLPLPSSLQEAVLTILAMDDKFGSSIAGQVRPEHFDGQYREVASAVLAYRRKYSTAPGKAHLEGLVLGAGGDQRVSALRRLLGRLITQAVSINAEYVAHRAQEFVRGQTLKTALMEASDRFLQEQEEGLVLDVEAILSAALRSRQEGLDAGIFLNDPKRGMAFLDHIPKSFDLGIPVLDRLQIGPVPGELLLYIAPKGSGKSWFCVHAGRQALHHDRARVVHITLEMAESRAVARYYQSIFGMSQRNEKYLRTSLEFEDIAPNVVAGFKSRRVAAKMSFTDPKVRKWLREKIKPWGVRLGRLVVKEFPSGSLTIAQLRGYLDFLEAAHNFIPHVLIVDYPDLMAIDRGNFRLELGRLYVELRGLAQERNLAVIAPTQGNRSALSARKVSADMVGEDVSKLFTADTVFTYSRTEEETRLGLGRLYAAHARNTEGEQTILMSQSYATGQYVLQSGYMNNKYWEQLDEASGKRKED